MNGDREAALLVATACLASACGAANDRAAPQAGDSTRATAAALRDAVTPELGAVGFDTTVDWMGPESVAVWIDPQVALAGLDDPIPAPDPWSFDEAARRVRRLPPSAFPVLPLDLQRILTGRGCRVPQTWRRWRDLPNNVVSGEFAPTGQTDWAVLCSDGTASSVVVFWGGTSRCDPVLAPAPDTYHSSTMDGEVAFGRSLLRAELTSGREGWPPDGIEDVYEGKASVIHLCIAGQWHTVSAGD